MKKINSETEQKIIELYNSGLSMAKVGEQYNISATTVLRILNRNNIPKRTKGGIYKISTEDIITRYKAGESCQSIADSYNVSFHTISNVLQQYNIPRNNKYYNLSLDENYFHNIDRYDKAYFLGFLIADGCINKNDNMIRLDLSNKDAYILEIFKAKTNNSNTLHIRQDKPETIFQLRSAKWKQDLAQYGVVPQKTSISYLPILSPNMMPHLIRGLIDGDGWISAKSHQIGFCGNEQIVTELHDFLIKQLDIYPVKILQTQPHLWQITWAAQKDIEKIGNYIYKDKQDCYLIRKFENFQKIQGNTEINN